MQIGLLRRREFITLLDLARRRGGVADRGTRAADDAGDRGPEFWARGFAH